MRGSCSQSKLALKILNFNRKNRQQQASQACVWVLYLIILLSIFQKMDLSSDDQTKMYFYENRLQTFVGWPFEEGCICTPENVSKPFGPSRWKTWFCRCWNAVFSSFILLSLFYRWPKLDFFTPRRRIVQIQRSVSSVWKSWKDGNLRMTLSESVSVKLSTIALESWERLCLCNLME